MISCNNCGNELSEGSLFCNKCGSKIILEDNITNRLSEEIAVSAENETDPTLIEKPLKKSKKRIIISFLAIVIVLGAGGGGYWYYTDQQKKEEAKQEALMNKYKDDLTEAAFRIVGFSVISEQVCNSYSDVWRRAIEADYGIRVNDKYATDFNEAITYQREEFEQKNILKAINENTTEINKIMQRLNNPSAEYQKAYDVMVELYGLYTQYADQANSPKGSLIEFNKKTNDLSAEISKDYNQFKILLPNLDESKITDYTKSISL